MINTIFYFPESLTFDQYTNLLDSDTDEGIARRTIVFARQQGKIYNNGKLYGTTSSDVQSLINAAKSELEAQDAVLNLSIEEAISLFSNNINSLLNEIESGIQNAINTAKSYDDLIKTDLNITNNQIAAVSTKVNQIEDRIDGFSEGGNIKYTQALQSVINSGINNNAAFNNISSRWAVADENQNLLQWMASGFLSQSEQGSSFAQIYSTDKSTINNNILSAAAAVKTAVSTNENGIVSSAMGQILSSLTNNEINNVSGLITKVDEKASLSDVISAISIANGADSKADSANSAVSSLSAALTALDGSVVKKASVIASINSSGESNVTINADKINLSGDVIAQKLIAANASIGGFSISQNELSGTYDYTTLNGQHLTHHTSIITLAPQGFSTTAITGIASNTTNQILTDGSGFLANGTFNWTQDGMIYGPVVNVADNVEDHAWSFNSNGEINTYKTIKLSAYSDDSYRYETAIEPNNIQLSHINGDVCNINLRSDGVHIDNPVVASGFATINGTGSRILLDNGNTMTFAELKAALDAI